MGGRTRTTALTAALVAALAGAAAPARADETIVAVPFDRYDPTEYTIDAGEKVTFANRDVSTHDVVGEGFRSAKIDGGETAPVEGAETLKAGTYDFLCSLHAGMVGKLVVRGGSSPPPSDPPPEQPPPPSEQPPADTTPPKVGVRVRAGLLRVTVDEAALIEVKAGRRQIRRSTQGPGTVRIRLRKGVRRVVLRVTDASGNRKTLTRRVPRRR